LGKCVIYPRTPASEIVPRLAGAGIAITNKVPLSADTIRALPDLRYIGVTATGYNIVDAPAARERGIPVTNVPTYGTRSVAQHTFALLLELCHRAGHHARMVAEGSWSRSPDWCFWDFPQIELDGLTLGLVGFGRIGRAVAELGQAFGMRIVAQTRTPPAAAPREVRFVGLDELFAASDVVSLHCPLTPETRHLVNTERLERMKPTAFLLNTSRGPLIDEVALAAALSKGRIAGAGLDVLSAEPPPADNPLLHAPNCLITPHNAWATKAARGRLMKVTVDNVRAFLGGTPTNVVNP
jgi:glycerate dehydrogenase